MVSKKHKKIKNSIPQQEVVSIHENNRVLKRWKYWHMAIIFITAVLFYFNTWNNGFVLDDSLFITGNSFTQQGLSGIKDIWTHDAFVGAHGREFDLEGGRYRPLSITVFAVVYELVGPTDKVNSEKVYARKMKSVAIFGHILNILIYGFLGIVVYLFLSSLFNDHGGYFAFFTTLIFIINPLHTEVVANIKSLDEMLSLLFACLTCLFILKGSSSKFMILSSLMWILALLSKESAITFLAVIPMIMWYKNVKEKGSYVRVIGSLLVVTVIYFILRQKFSAGFGQGFKAENVMDSPYILADFEEKWSTIIYICGKYLRMTVMPWPLSFDYSFNAIPYKSFTDWRVWVSFLSYAVLVWAGIKGAIKKEAYAFGIWFYIFTFSIVSNITFNIGAPMGERFAFTPSLGVSILLASLYFKSFKLPEYFTFRHKLWLPLMVIIPLTFWQTTERNTHWKSNFTLYEHDIHVVPESARARLFYGIELLGQHYKRPDINKVDQAIEQMEYCVKINDRFYHGWYNLGLAYQAIQDHSNAVRSFEKVLSIQTRHINSHYYLGLSYAQGFQRYDEAIKLITKAIEVGYNGADKYVNLGVTYGMKGDLQNALSAFLNGVKDNPSNANLFMNIAITYEQLQLPEKAKTYYDKAFQLDPGLKEKR